MSDFTLVTIAEYRSLVEAEMASSLLESAGIISFLKDKNMGSWYYQSIKLQVPDFLAVEARQMLENSGVC